MAKELPVVRKISGRLQNLRMVTLRKGAQTARTTFRTYHFELELQQEDPETHLFLMHRARKMDDRFALAFTVAAGFGDVIPFLAEGDRVDMAVQFFEDSPTRREPLVYALRNLEDDFAYVSQTIFLPGFEFGYGARYSLPGMSRRRRTRTFSWIACAYLIAFLATAIPFWLNGDKDMVAIMGALMMGLFVICLGAIAWQDLRKRFGWPSPRQRLLASVFSLLSLGSPDAPVPRVHCM
ncbi:hypothetical protein [Rhizobium binxianense]